MKVFAHWGDQAYCDCDYPEYFARLVERKGPPDMAKPADWEETGLGIRVALHGETDPARIKEQVLRVVEAAARPTVCQYCGGEGHEC